MRLIDCTIVEMSWSVLRIEFADSTYNTIDPSNIQNLYKGHMPYIL